MQVRPADSHHVEVQSRARATDSDFCDWCDAQRMRVEQALSDWVREDMPAGLGEVMRYAVLGAGKRLRALLVLAASQAMDGHDEAALRAACAVELIHAYSLVHDDLPCMDNDVLRRGKPTAHVQFGEAQALLAGDALQALAFELLTPADDAIPVVLQARLCAMLARAAGAAGMAGGQAIDLASVGKRLTENELRLMHELKTGALLQTSVEMGVACAAGVPDERTRSALGDFGAAVGLAFQVVDDILDVTADSDVLGKTAGKDAGADKPTYVSLLGLTPARTLAQTLLEQAHQALDAAGLGEMTPLRALADQLVKRTS